MPGRSRSTGWCRSCYLDGLGFTYLDGAAPRTPAGRSWGPIAPRRGRGARTCAPWPAFFRSLLMEDGSTADTLFTVASPARYAPGARNHGQKTGAARTFSQEP